MAMGPDLRSSVVRAMGKAGLHAKVINGRGWKALAGLGAAYPVIAINKDGYWVIVVSATRSADGQWVAAVLDPMNEAEGIKLISRDDFVETWSGTLILCRRVYAADDEGQPFGLRWFLPEIMRNAAALRGVAIAAIMMNLISFGMPMLFQVLVDKVITHHSYPTLYFVVIVYLILTGFEAVFSYIRQMLMLHASNRIDARLVSRTFRHLLSLPLPFFETTAAGVLTRHMQQTERLRHFLTGRLFQLMLDLAVLPILIVLLVTYSAKLTVMVFCFALAIASVMGLMLPIYRQRLNMLYQAEGARQAHLVETIHGMRAVKSLVLEPVRQRAWDDKLAQAIRSYVAVGRTGALGGSITSAIEKMMQISVLAVGAVSVFDGTLSMGALIAFNMLSGRVTGPLLQMVGLINEWQETSLSVKMLGTVMNHPPERGRAARGARPVITGAMSFDDVSFRYDGAMKPVLDRVNFKIEEGQMIGVVGRSGSGKTTVTRLIQGIHSAQAGIIRLDGTDIRQIDLDHLRRSIGVVLQDNLLFRGTIRENIAAARPDASIGEILEAARMAGADEFIDRLPNAYDTFVEENAANFSGGQRQRIAIARAVLTRPRLLVFDEATSALDPDSEAIVQKNLSEIARGRTMLIVSHRLSSLTKSDSILVLEQGNLVDFAPHYILLERCDVYRHLWHQQTQHVQ